MDHITSIPIASLKIHQRSYCMQHCLQLLLKQRIIYCLFVWSPVFSWCAEPVCILASTMASSITTTTANLPKFSNIIYSGERENIFPYMKTDFIKVMRSTQTKILFFLIQIWHFIVLLPEKILKSHIRIICNVLFLIYCSNILTDWGWFFKKKSDLKVVSFMYNEFSLIKCFQQRRQSH